MDGYERVDLDKVKFIGRSNDITRIWYIGHPSKFVEFCDYIYTHMPNVTFLRFHNMGISEIPARNMNRLVSLDCSYNPIKKLRYGPDLRVLVAPGTDLALSDVLYSNEQLNYLKIGSIEDETRITIDSPTEYQQFRTYALTESQN